MSVTKKQLCVAVALNEIYKTNEEFDLNEFIELSKKISLPFDEFIISTELEKTVVKQGIHPKNVIDYLITIYACNSEQRKRESNVYFNELIRDQFIMPTVWHMLQV